MIYAIFMALVLLTLVAGLLGVTWLRTERGGYRPAVKFTVFAFALLVVANLLSVVAEAGWNWDLPADPVKYLIFK